MKLVAFGVMSLSFAAGLALAEPPLGEWSSMPVRIVALEVGGDAPGAIRLGVRQSFQKDRPFFVFNPAGCTDLTTLYNFAANNGDEPTHFVDVEWTSTGRSKTEQQQLMNEIHGAFATSREVLFLLSAERCSAARGRLVLGVRILD